MKRLLYVFAILSFLFCSRHVASAQDIAGVNQIKSGFAVITPLDGDDPGLSVSEVFGQQVSGILFRSSVLPSPLVTITSVVTRSDPNTATDTGIAIVNPNSNAATVALTLNNQQGITIGERTITIEGRQQISRFVTEVFAGNPELSGPFAGLLFITTDIPVGVLGLAFTGPSFTSLPVATQLTAINTSVTGTITVTTITPQTSTAGTATTFTGAIPPVGPIPPLVPQTVPTPLPITITQIPSTFPTLAPNPPLTTQTTQIPPSATFRSVGLDVIPIPPIALGIGGIAAQLLPQVVTGGGWSSTIAIANTSAVSRLVRADFFDSEGNPLLLPFGSGVASIVVPAGGVVTLSTN